MNLSLVADGVHLRDIHKGKKVEKSMTKEQEKYLWVGMSFFLSMIFHFRWRMADQKNGLLSVDYKIWTILAINFLIVIRQSSNLATCSLAHEAKASEEVVGIEEATLQ